MNTLPAFDPLGLPAPLWLLFGLKVFGFWLHLIFMNLWLAGLPVALVLAGRSGKLGEAGDRMLKGMPIFIAFGINAGVVPLLFLQVLYPQFFYASTTLQAWSWFAVIALVLIAYYAIYLYVLETKRGRTGWLVKAAGWSASILFLAVGLVFVSEMQLLTRPEAWSALAATSVGGAVNGAHLALNGTALSRLGMMIGIALGTAAAYFALDASLIRRDERVAAARAVSPVVLLLAVAGALLFMVAGIAYVSLIGPVKELGMFQGLAAAGPALAVAGGMLYFVRPGKTTAAFLVAAQMVSLLVNAIERQIVQFLEIARSFDVKAVPVNFQVSPVVLFVATLVVGLGIVGWLLGLFVGAARGQVAESAVRPHVMAGS
jgi:hypothetical protein